MDAPPHDHAAAREALADVARRTDQLLASAAGAAMAVPGSLWTVREVGTHVLIALRGFTDAVRGDDARWAGLAGPSGSFHDRLAAFNTQTIAKEPTRDLVELGQLILAATEDFLAASADRLPDDRVVTPWYGEGASLTVSAATCLLLAEQVVHGYDVALAVGRAWPISRQEACLVFHAITSMMPMVVDVDAARGVTAAFDIHLRGGQRFVVRIDDGTAHVEAPGTGSVDCHLSADPVAFMLVGYGRVGQWRAIARGQLVPWGRRPWRAIQIKGLFSNP